MLSIQKTVSTAEPVLPIEGKDMVNKTKNALRRYSRENGNPDR